MSDEFTTMWHRNSYAETIERIKKEAHLYIRLYIHYQGYHEIKLPGLSVWHHSTFQMNNATETWKPLPYAVKKDEYGNSEWILGDVSAPLYVVKIPGANTYKNRALEGDLGEKLRECYAAYNQLNHAQRYSVNLETTAALINYYNLATGQTLKIYQFRDLSGYYWELRSYDDQQDYASPVYKKAPELQECLMSLVEPHPETDEEEDEDE